MSNNEFAPFQKDNSKFIVLNITNPKKMVNIFHYPIVPGGTRDILGIPGVAEADIRASLLKGELRNKIKHSEIVVLESDIDLLQFNADQYQFLSTAGILYGTKVTADQVDGYLGSGGGSINYLWRQQINPIGIKNGINRIFFTPDIFLDGDYDGNTFRIAVNFDGRLLVRDIDYTISKTGGGSDFNTISFISLTPKETSQIYLDYIIAN